MTRCFRHLGDFRSLPYQFRSDVRNSGRSRLLYEFLRNLRRPDNPPLLPTIALDEGEGGFLFLRRLSVPRTPYRWPYWRAEEPLLGLPLFVRLTSACADSGPVSASFLPLLFVWFWFDFFGVLIIWIVRPHPPRLLEITNSCENPLVEPLTGGRLLPTRIARNTGLAASATSQCPWGQVINTSLRTSA